METVLLEITDNKAFKFLRELEEQHLIRLLGKDDGFLDHLESIDSEENRFEALEYLYEKIDDDLAAGKTDQCNDKIDGFLKRNFSFKLHLGLLTITCKRKNELKSRAQLYQNTYKLALKRYQNETEAASVLFGLK